MAWEVQEKTWDGWENMWTIWDESGESDNPETFATREDAEQALKDYLDEIHQAVKDGDMEEDYDPAGFRVVEVPNA